MNVYAINSPSRSSDMVIKAKDYDDALNKFAMHMGYKDYFDFLRAKGMIAGTLIDVSLISEDRKMH